MNGQGKSFRKNPIQKSKTVKIKVKLPHVNKKSLSRKPLFCSNTFLSLYFKIRVKKFYAAKPLAFSLQFLFRHHQNHYSNLTSKIMKMCEQIFKKRQRPNTIQFLWIVKILWIVKKTKRRPIIAPAIAVRLLNMNVFIENMLEKRTQKRSKDGRIFGRLSTIVSNIS